MAAIPLPSRPLVLNVDDHEDVRYVRSRLLKAAGFEVREAETGAEAVRLATELRPDLVLLDVNLPDISGLEVCRQIKGNFGASPVPILQITSAHRDAETNARSLDSGADAYLTEPVDPAVLVATANALLRPARLAAELGRAREQLERRYVEMARMRVGAEAVAERLNKLQTVTAALSEADTLDEVLDVVVDRIRALTTAATSSVALLTPDGKSFEVVRTAGYSGTSLRNGRVFPSDSRFPVADAVKNRDVVFIHDARERTRRYPELPDTGVDGAVIAVPMILHGRIIGGLGLRFAGGRRFTPHDREFYMNMGAQCAAAIERAKLHDSERRLLERERLARKRLERLAAESSLRAQLIDLSPDAVIVCNAERRITEWNRGATGTYGWTAEEALGRNVDELLGTQQSMLEKFAHQDHWEGELPHTRRDGSHLTVESRHVAIRDEEGRPVAYLEINRDLTERLRNEQALRSAQKLESVGLLAGGVAHDFNNLLTAILGHASMLDHMQSEAERHSVSAIQQAAERAAELTRQLLAYAGKGNFVMELVDISQLVHDMASLLRSAVPARAGLSFDLAPNLPGVIADPGQIQQLVLNLVTNAGEALHEDGSGTVCVRTRTSLPRSGPVTLRMPEQPLDPGLYVCFEVSDNGSGIDPAILPKIFDPFVTTRFFGRGLGLGAVQGIVRSLRGAIEVESTPGQGSSFRVLLPAAQAGS